MNAKHQFKYTYNEGCEEFSPCDITFDMPGDVTIRQMLWNFECYLKACGFVFDGNLEIVSDDVCADTIDDTDYSCKGDSATVTDNEWLKKIQWVHGMCNPPASDWSEAKNEPDNCWNS